MFQKHLQTTPSPVFSEPPISNAAELQACPTPGKPPLPKKLPASLPGAKASPFLPWTFCLFFFMGPVRTDWQKQTGEGSFPRTLEGASAGEGEVAVSALCLMPPVSAGRTHGCGDKVTAAPVLRRLRELLAPIPEPLFGPLEGVCVCVCVCLHAQSLSHVSLFATPWTTAHHAPLSTRFFRQEYESGLPFPPPGDLPDPRIKPVSPALPALIGGFFTTEPTGKPY